MKLQLKTRKITKFNNKLFKLKSKTGIRTIKKVAFNTKVVGGKNVNFNIKNSNINKFKNFKISKIFKKNLHIGDKVPDFKADTTKGEIDFHDWQGDSWSVLFSHPADFTPVCTTELGRVQQLQNEFDKRNVKTIALSTDSVDMHHQWIKDIVGYNRLPEVSYPIIGDKDRSISTAYGMLDQTNIDNEGLPLTVRSVFVIAPDKSLKALIAYPASTGRNFDEIIRLIDSLQLTMAKSVATPVDWEQGDNCIVVPSITTEDAKKQFPEVKETDYPYIRLVRDPTEK